MKPLTKMGSKVDIAKLICHLLGAADSFHKLHLKVKGPGSFAAHMALGDLYDALRDHVDTVAEGYQGASGKLLDIPNETYEPIETVPAAIESIRELYEMISGVQEGLPYSEVVNDLDAVKSSLNKAKYKLLNLA